MTNPTVMPRSSEGATTSIIAETIKDQGTEPALLVDLIKLFNAYYSSNHGNAISFTPAGAAAAGTMLGMAAAGKRGAEVRSPRSPASLSPVNKLKSIISLPSSLPRQSMLTAAASFIKSVVAPPSTQGPQIFPPPALHRNHPLPTSTLATVFLDQPPSPKTIPKGKRKQAVIGLVLKHIRPNHFNISTTYTKKHTKVKLKNTRTSILYHFTQQTNADVGPVQDDVHGERDHPNTPSNADNQDDWMVDTSAVYLTTTNPRQLTLYPLEQIFLCAEKTKLLLMIKVEDDDRLLRGKGQEVQAVQGTETRFILRLNYFALKFTLCDTRNHVDVRGKGTSKYTNEHFEKDFDKRRGDFKISFNDTAVGQTLD